MLAAPTTKLFEFKTLGSGLFVFRRRVVPTFAVTTLEHNIIARHNPTSFPIGAFAVQI
jgi:hypothetical protein